MIELSKKMLNIRVTGIYNNFQERTLTISFQEDFVVKFNECAISFDLGITGHIVSYVSDRGTLGMTLELKKMKLNPEDYNYFLISRDIEDYDNKNELIISYKNFEIVEN